jgi:C-terminal processing protease CtpA/Prc
MLAEMRARPGQHIALPEARQGFPAVQPGPRRVAILFDGTGASSTETFLLKARQSRKVRFFGRPTAGIVDYLNPAHHELGCGTILQAPTIRRSVRLPQDAIDNVGISPDVIIPAGVNALQHVFGYYTAR